MDTYKSPVSYELLRRMSSEKIQNIEALNGSLGGGNSGGMDPWQTSVEARLGQIQTDMATVKERISHTATDANLEVVKGAAEALKERVSHLPSKEWIDKRLGTILAIITALIVFSDKIHALLK